MLPRLLAVLLSCVLLAGCGGENAAPEAETAASNEALTTDAAQGQPLFAVSLVEGLPEGDWQTDVTFPDARGYVDNTLALNSMAEFQAYRGAGELYIRADSAVKEFQLYVNGKKADTSQIRGGFVYRVDLSEAVVNGRNTLQVSGITPSDIKGAVRVCIPYPTIREGSPAEAGIHPEAVALLELLIETDAAHGFPGSQLAVIRNGVLAYENAWGSTCVTHPSVSADAVSVPVTTETLYDLASVTKMFAVNYALQKLVTEGTIDMDATVASFLGEDFLDHTQKRAETDEETMRRWKENLTLKELAYHSAGFPEDPRSFGFYYDTILHTDDREEIIQALYQVPLVYAPGTDTRYSDMDYMLLGLVVEHVTGKDLDAYLKETFCEPLGLTHITFNPLQNGFSKEQIAATALTGTTLDGRVKRAGIRSHTLQGEVHDENAFHAFGGVSGHAGLFANATDLAKLASLMLAGGEGSQRFFSAAVIDAFTAAKSEKEPQWGIGWWRQAKGARSTYFGSQASADAFGHQGFTGTIVMIDPERELVIAYLTNRINSPVVQDPDSDYLFSASCFTAASLGAVPQILSIGMDETEENIEEQLMSLLVSMTDDAFRMIPEDASEERRAPLEKNLESKLALLNAWAERSGRADFVEQAKAVTSRYAGDAESGAVAPDFEREGIVCGDARFEEYLPLLSGKRVALYANHTAVIEEAEGRVHLADALLSRDVTVTQIFAPEHGFRGEAAAGVAVQNGVDAQTGLPVISLYNGAQTTPTQEQTDAFDVLLVDIQDVGCRFYTYYITMTRLMEVCAAAGKTVIVLDRPNPNGHFTDGPLLREEYRSGVGALPLPVVHGMTLGELAQMIRGEGWISNAAALDLKVIPCAGYTHDTPVDITIAPSPALADTRAVLLYPSLCFFENSALSVGRGTDTAFTVYGSPSLAGAQGCDFSFTPEASSGAPFAGELCYGRDLRALAVSDIRAEASINLSYLLDAYHTMRTQHPEISFFGTPDGAGRYWIDYLFGTDSVRLLIEEGADESVIRASWAEELETFRNQRKAYLLYP